MGGRRKGKKLICWFFLAPGSDRSHFTPWGTESLEFLGSMIQPSWQLQGKSESVHLVWSDAGAGASEAPGQGNDQETSPTPSIASCV